MKKQLQNEQLQIASRQPPELTPLGHALPAPDAGSFTNAVRVTSPASMKADRAITRMPLAYFVGREVWVPSQTPCGMVENLSVRVTGIEDDDLVGTLDTRCLYAEYQAGPTQIKVSPSQISRVERSLAEWRAETEMLMTVVDYYNPWRGVPCGWRFDQLHRDGFSPIDALELWRDWVPIEDD